MIILRFIVLTLSFMIIMPFAFAQDVYDNYKDGEVYITLEENYYHSHEQKPLDFLERLNFKGKFSNIRRPFTIDNERLNRTWQISFKPAENIDSLLYMLNSHEAIQLAEKVPLSRIFFSPNDPLYSTTVYNYNWNWYLDVIEAEAAWNISKGSSNIRVAVVDNAIYTQHEDLKNKIVREKDVSDNDGDASPPAVGSSYDKYIWSHGTHCSGLVGAETNNNKGIAGIGYNVSLIAVKATPDTASGEYTYSGTSGVQWAAQKGADVISISWGGTGYSSTHKSFYQTLKNQNIIVLAAAGNDGNTSNSKQYPAGYNSVIAVGSTNNDDKRSSFSQYGTWLDISAPGGYYPSESNNNKISILSTTYNDAYVANPPISGKYDISQGTSMSTPIAAGLAGLLKSEAPSASFQTVKNCLLWGCEDIDAVNDPQYSGKMGEGRINARNSLECITGTDTRKQSEPDISLFPNPAEKEVLIRGLSSFQFALSIYDLTGRKILSKTLDNNLVNVAGLNAGTYFFEIVTDDQKIMKKVVIY